jgi:hypothetical protein
MTMQLVNYIRNVSAALCLFLFSCNGDHRRIKFVIHNNAHLTIDSVVVVTSTNVSRVSIRSIEPGSSKEDLLEMTGEPRGDGNYNVSIIAGVTTYTNNIGYFTNGAPVEEKMEIWFSTDTIRYKPKAKQRYAP